MNDNVPDFTARLQYDAPGGHKFQLSGVLRNLRIDGDGTAGVVTGSDSEIAWGLLGAASLNLADIATLTAMATYGDGIGRYVINGGFASGIVNGTAANPDIDTIEVWSVVAALAIGVTDTTTMNVAVGYYDQANSDSVAGQIDDLTTVHVNLIWQPVSRFRMGVEGMWGDNDLRRRKQQRCAPLPVRRLVLLLGIADTRIRRARSSLRALFCLHRGRPNACPSAVSPGQPPG